MPSRREENLKQLAAMGVLLAPEDPELPPPPPALVPNPDPPENPDDQLSPPDDSVPPPVPPVPAPKSPEEKHDWEKRKADAQAEQRALSKLQSEIKERERALDSRIKALDEKERKLDALVAKLEKQEPPPPPSMKEGESEILQALKADYPDLYQAMSEMLERSITPVAKTVEEERAERKRKEEEREAKAKTEAERKATENADKVISAVLEKHPDAFEVVEGPAFLEWLNKFPPALRQTYAEIIEHTADYTPADAIEILDVFKKTITPAPEPPRRTPVDSGPSLRQSQPPPPAGVVLEPFTLEELGSLDKMMRTAKNADERAMLKKRLEITYNQT